MVQNRGKSSDKIHVGAKMGKKPNVNGTPGCEGPQQNFNFN